MGGCPYDRRVIRVLLVDDDALVRTGLRLILSSNPGIEVVAEATDGDEAVPAFLAHRPDVVLMDLRMARVQGIEATRALRALPDPPVVLVLTSFESDTDVLGALESGAGGFLLKDASPTELIGGVLAVADGESVLAPRVVRYVVSRVAQGQVTSEQQRARALLGLLTEREREIAQGVAEGLSNAQIGERLYCAEATVKTHLSRTMTKLDLPNRVAVAIAVERAR